MNNVQLMGRLTRDPEVTYTQGGEPLAVARFSLAVNRRGKDDKADFINCVAFGKTGEFVSKYFTKGQMMALTGRIQVNQYQDKEGNNRNSTDIVADQIYFTGSKAESGASGSTPQMDSNPSGFYADAPAVEDDLPF
ncbi:MAG: single-stranded DNA-binding protein [Clostridia bacterium]|nr:single-stranded DNA-binding protein [Clostridia bacterium]